MFCSSWASQEQNQQRPLLLGRGVLPGDAGGGRVASPEDQERVVVVERRF